MNCGSKLNPIHMMTLAKIIPSAPSTTTGSINPFPRMVAIALSTTAGKPRLTNPSRNPLLLGTILHGPVFRNLAIPNPPERADNIIVKAT